MIYIATFFLGVIIFFLLQLKKYIIKIMNEFLQKNNARDAKLFDWFDSEDFNILDVRLMKKYMYINNAISIFIAIMSVLFFVVICIIFLSIW
jgi:hypothetical protein